MYLNILEESEANENVNYKSEEIKKKLNIIYF